MHRFRRNFTAIAILYQVDMNNFNGSNSISEGAAEQLVGHIAILDAFGLILLTLIIKLQVDDMIDMAGGIHMIVSCIGSRCETSLGTKLLFIGRKSEGSKRERALNRSYVVRRFFRSDLNSILLQFKWPAEQLTS